MTWLRSRRAYVWWWVQASVSVCVCARWCLLMVFSTVQPKVFFAWSHTHPESVYFTWIITYGPSQSLSFAWHFSSARYLFSFEPVSRRGYAVVAIRHTHTLCLFFRICIAYLIYYIVSHSLSGCLTSFTIMSHFMCAHVSSGKNEIGEMHTLMASNRTAETQRSAISGCALTQFKYSKLCSISQNV